MSNAKILIVEDEYLIAEGIQEKLEAWGYKVTGIASSGTLAIDNVISNQPDLILMDIMIKGEMDGIETAAKIKEKFDIPVIYLTAYFDGEVIERAKFTEPYGYLIKPFRDNELSATIKMALYKSVMDKKLLTVRTWLTKIINSVWIGLICTDEKGKIQLINPRAVKITGWKKAEAIGKTVTEIFPVRLTQSTSLDTQLNREITDSEIEELSTEHIGSQLIQPGIVIKKVSTFGDKNVAVLTTLDGRQINIYGSVAPINLDDEFIGAVIVFQELRK